MKKPSWWTPGRYLGAIGLLAAAVLLALLWSAMLRRQVQHQTETIEEQVEQNIILQERNRIARELHDTLSQGFAGVGFQLDSLKKDVGNNPIKAHEKLSLARRMVEHSMAEARESLTNLRSPLLDGQSLGKAIATGASQICQTAGIKFETNLDDEESTGQLGKRDQHEFLRIALEAVANAVKHSEAGTITLNLKEDGETVHAVIVDDGTGFNPDDFKNKDDHFGIRGMRERARAIDADLEIRSQRGQGTAVTLSIPVTDPV